MKISDIPCRSFPVPKTLRFNGYYVDNRNLSNTRRSGNAIRFLDARYPNVEAAFVAAKNPHAIVHGMPFYKFVEQWCRTPGNRVEGVKKLGKPKSRGGLIDTVPEWEHLSAGAMYDFTSQKFASGADKEWLIAQPVHTLIEFNNWGDDRWGACFKQGQTTACGRNLLGEILQEHHATIESGKWLGQYSENDWEALHAAVTRRIYRSRSR